MRWCAERDAGAWIAPRLYRLAGTVATIVPTGFGGYAKVPNEETPDGASSLSERKLRELERILRPATGDQECYFAFWDGYGWLSGPPVSASLPGPGGDQGAVHPWLPGGLGSPVPNSASATIHGQTYLLYEGDLAGCAALLPVGQTPNLWWPRDRSWCVATDFDLDVSYVAADLSLIAEVIGSAVLDAVPTSQDDHLPNLPPSAPDRSWPRWAPPGRVPRRRGPERT